MGDVYPRLKVAAVQAAPVMLDREATIEKACRLILEAGVQGAQVIGFPEGFIPAHPVWFHFHPVLSPKSRQFGVELFKNAVEIPSPATDALCAAAREANAYVVMGLCEKRPGTTGTMYNTQLFIDRFGRIIGKHQKVMPTIGERMVHTGGFGDSMGAFPTEFGPISGLICGENQNPLAVFTLAADSTVLHVASWPHFFQKGWHPMATVADLASRAFAYMTKAFVINVCGTIDDAMEEDLVADPEDSAFLHTQGQLGGSSIISATSQVIAGPMGSEEGILYADVDVETAVAAKLTHDFAGHYNRPDVFQVRLEAEARQLFVRTDRLDDESDVTRNRALPSEQRGTIPGQAAPSEGTESGSQDTLLDDPAARVSPDRQEEDNRNSTSVTMRGDPNDAGSEPSRNFG